MLEKNQIHSHYAEKYNSMKGMKITQSIKTVFNFEKTRDEKGMKENRNAAERERKREKGSKENEERLAEMGFRIDAVEFFFFLFFFLSSSLYFLSFLLTLNAIVDY